MTDLHQLEIIINIILQGVGTWTVLPMKIFSFFGTEEWYLVIIPAIFWCINPILGLRMALILLVSINTNTFFKMSFHNPRPYWIDPAVTAFLPETSFGMPSGHSQSSAAIWGVLAATVQRTWFAIACVLLIFFIGVSRLFLGVHFLSDVFLGWGLGGLTLFLFVRYEPAVTGWVKRAPTIRLVWAAAAFSLLLVLLVAIPGLALRAWTIPPDWTANALAATPDDPIDPFNLDTAFTTGGLAAGILFGALWIARKQGGYALKGTLKSKVLRYLLGVAVLLILWFGLGKVFPRNPDLLSYVLRYIRYGLLGLWVSVLAPLVFKKLHLDE